MWSEASAGGRGPVLLWSLARPLPDFLQNLTTSSYDPCLPTTANSWLQSDRNQPHTPAEGLCGPGTLGSNSPSSWQLTPQWGHRELLFLSC